jgi:hypothetical protein
MDDRIHEHMEVLGADGEHIGTVDYCDGASITLTKSDPASGGKHHNIPLEWVERLDAHVHLSKTADDVMKKWEMAD